VGVDAEISRVGGPLQAATTLTEGPGPGTLTGTAVIYGHLLPPGPRPEPKS